jgi:hypothetical protein
MVLFLLVLEIYDSIYLSIYLSIYTIMNLYTVEGTYLSCIG